MKNEQILIADDKESHLKQLLIGIPVISEDGHVVVGTASSVEEVKKLIEDGLKPTIALVDHRFPGVGDGQKAADIIRKFSPETIIVSFSSDPDLRWGDDNWHKGISIAELVKALTNLQH